MDGKESLFTTLASTHFDRKYVLYIRALLDQKVTWVCRKLVFSIAKPYIWCLLNYLFVIAVVHFTRVRESGATELASFRRRILKSQRGRRFIPMRGIVIGQTYRTQDFSAGLKAPRTNFILIPIRSFKSSASMPLITERT